ncbi:MAG: hypothetical protein MUO50_19435 [Longimicrobiales bacterium]|nr:hypothetical protein [Longimicrobiales bacterium]
MSYVPIVTSTYVPPPSPRTRELAGLLSRVLEEYTKAHPATSKTEIRAAIRMAQMSSGPDRTKVAAGLGLAVGLGVMMLTLGLFFFRSTGGMEIRASLPFIIMFVIFFLMIVLAIVKAQSR